MRKVTCVASDAGGTMTDMFFVDEEGNFVIGKASTTPRDEFIGFWESMKDAAEQWGIDLEKESQKVLPSVEVISYAGTTMMNVLLTRLGDKIGLIVTKGQEDHLMHGRGRQSYAGYSYDDRLHTASHIHEPPLVPRRLVKGVTERVNMFGEIVIPLYEDEARQVVEELLEENVNSIAVSFLYSYLNPENERRMREIAQEVMKGRDREVPILLSSEISPIMREGSRINAVTLQAYGAEPVRKQLLSMEKRLRERGYKYPLQILLSTGGIARITYPRLIEAFFSGPIGGMMGARAISQTVGIPNLVCTDLGGTSFDVGLIIGGEYFYLREVEMGRMLFNIPTVWMDSIGGGTGEYIRIDPVTKRLIVGPESAGAEPGPVCYNMGNTIPTVMDCMLIMGWLNPNYYLGGKLPLHTKLAYDAIKEKLADPLGLDPYEVAEGAVNILSNRTREEVRTRLFARGLSPADFHLLIYGGAGPLLMAEISRGLPFKGIFTVWWAAAFSAFGVAGMDHIHRYNRSTSIYVPHGAGPEEKMRAGEILNEIWEDLEKIANKDLDEEGIPKDQRKFQQVAYLRYFLQLDDVETPSPVNRIKSPEEWDGLINSFEEIYSNVFGEGAKQPEAGYQILEAGLIATAPRVKPALRKRPVSGESPPQKAYKGRRRVFYHGEWHDAKIWEMELLEPGNVVEGMAIIEQPATTLVVPPDRKVRVDEWGFLWMYER
ncbi:MAG: hydantoinase/oxoprolinase family protein [Thermoproteota archaeon]|nr:MAG: hydantoinase/oxoprolinase family protein [Candidatus Korarchaeota archaeon]